MVGHSERREYYLIITLTLAALFARIRGYKVSTVFKTWTIYLIICLELIHIFFQINSFAGNYHFVSYAALLKKVYLYSFLIPMFVFKLYKPGIIGSGFILLGTLLNNFVMSQNGGKMPVYPTLSYLTGYVKPDTFDSLNDIHILGDAATKWKILTDYIDTGWSVLSIGDLCIHFFAFIMLFNIIKTMNIRMERNGKHDTASVVD